MHTIANGTCVCYPEYYLSNSFFEEEELWPLCHVYNPFFITILTGSTTIPMWIILLYELYEEYSLFIHARFGLPVAKKFELEPLDTAFDITLGIIGIILGWWVLMILRKRRSFRPTDVTRKGFRYAGMYGKGWPWCLVGAIRICFGYLNGRRDIVTDRRKDRQTFVRMDDHRHSDGDSDGDRDVYGYERDNEMSSMPISSTRIGNDRKNIGKSERNDENHDDRDLSRHILSQFVIFPLFIGYAFFIPDLFLVRLNTFFGLATQNAWFRLDLMTYFVWLCHLVGLSYTINRRDKYALRSFWGNDEELLKYYHILWFFVVCLLFLPLIYTWTYTLSMVLIGVCLCVVMLGIFTHKLTNLIPR